MKLARWDYRAAFDEPYPAGDSPYFGRTRLRYEPKD
jgi:hypothetical protein